MKTIPHETAMALTRLIEAAARQLNQHIADAAKTGMIVEASNLRAWCQKCHNTYDAPNRAKGVKARRRAALAIPDLFDPCPAPGECFPDEDRTETGPGEFE